MKQLIDTILTAIHLGGYDPEVAHTMIAEALTRVVRADLVGYRDAVEALVAPNNEFSRKVGNRRGEDLAEEVVYEALDEEGDGSSEDEALEDDSLVQALNKAYQAGYVRAKQEIVDWLNRSSGADREVIDRCLPRGHSPHAYAWLITSAHELAGRNSEFLEALLTGSFSDIVASLNRGLEQQISGRKLRINDDIFLDRSEIKEAEDIGFNAACDAAAGLLRVPGPAAT